MDPTEVNIEQLMNGQAFGPVANQLVASGMNINALRPYIEDDGKCYVSVNEEQSRLVTHATLRKDEWKQYDQAIIKAATTRLTGVSDLYSRGLTYNIANGLGKTVLEYEDQSDIEDAEINMDGRTMGRMDRVEFQIKYLPLPIVHKEFQINARVLAASRTTGQALDTTNAELSSRKIAEKLESILFTGSSSFTYGGGTIYGYTDFPYRTTGSLAAAWNGSSATGATIVEDVRNMKADSISDRHYGPWVLYVPTNFESVLDRDYSSGYPKTIRQRILEIEGIEAVRVADALTASNVVLVQMSPETVRMVVGMPVSMIQWSVDGGMLFKFKIMTIQVPQIRGDQNNRSGVVHYS